MTSELQERITVKMFVGCLLTSDLQFILNQSHSWKEWLITQKSTDAPLLEEIRFKNKGYLGCYCDDENIAIAQIEILHEYIREKFSEFCPTADTSSLKIYVFSQVFIS